MAGSSRIVKENEVLFRNGDPADAMYLVRKGALKVYFMKGAEEVILATLNDGSIVGEMAFFDDKPRSASVKASAPTEVTVITKADFEKLLKQIPPWFVAMMKSLSGRLRQTNDRLATLEADRAAGARSSLILPGQIHPFQHIVRCFQIIMLSFAKDGNKDNPKELSLDSDLPRGIWVDFFGDAERGMFDRILSETVKTGFITLKPVPQKGALIQFVNRGGFAHFSQFFGEMAKKFKPEKPFFTADGVAFFEALVEAVAASGYPQFAVSVADCAKSAAAKGANVQAWLQNAADLQLLPEVKFAGAGKDTTVRLSVKEHKLILHYLKLMQIYQQSGLM